MGVYFNDNTKLIQDENKNFFYYERQGAAKGDVLTQFPFDNVPREFVKKVQIHSEFTKYINGDEKSEATEIVFPEVNDKVAFVKKYIRTKHAIMFRLSTFVVQVMFQDKTEVLICTDTKLVTYRNRGGRRDTWTMRETLAME